MNVLQIQSWPSAKLYELMSPLQYFVNQKTVKETFSSIVPEFGLIVVGMEISRNFVNFKALFLEQQSKFIR